jgi:hypothetical protein
MIALLGALVFVVAVGVGLARSQADHADEVVAGSTPSTITPTVPTTSAPAPSVPVTVAPPPMPVDDPAHDDQSFKGRDPGAGRGHHGCRPDGHGHLQPGEESQRDRPSDDRDRDDADWPGPSPDRRPCEHDGDRPGPE